MWSMAWHGMARHVSTWSPWHAMFCHCRSLHALCLCSWAAENIMSFDQRFWLRLATRSDAATDDEQRKQLSDLAKVGRREDVHSLWCGLLRSTSCRHMSVLRAAAQAAVRPCQAGVHTWLDWWLGLMACLVAPACCLCCGCIVRKRVQSAALDRRSIAGLIARAGSSPAKRACILSTICPAGGDAAGGRHRAAQQRAAEREHGAAAGHPEGGRRPAGACCAVLRGAGLRWLDSLSQGLRCP